MGLDTLIMGLAEKVAKDAQAIKDESTSLEALAPHFENGKEALAYAKRLAQLKPGDTVLLPNEAASGLQKAVFIKMDEGYRILSLFYDPKLKRLCVQQTSLFAVVLPD